MPARNEHHLQRSREADAARAPLQAADGLAAGAWGERKVGGARIVRRPTPVGRCCGCCGSIRRLAQERVSPSPDVRMTCVVVVILILTAKAPRDEQDEHGSNGEDDGEPDGRRHLLSAQCAMEAFIARATAGSRSVTARAVRGAVILAIMVVTAAAYHRMVIGADPANAWGES